MEVVGSEAPGPESTMGHPPLFRGPHLGTGGGLLQPLVFPDAHKPREAKGDALLIVDLGRHGP